MELVSEEESPEEVNEVGNGAPDGDAGNPYDAQTPTSETECDGMAEDASLDELAAEMFEDM